MPFEEEQSVLAYDAGPKSRDVSANVRSAALLPYLGAQHLERP